MQKSEGVLDSTLRLLWPTMGVTAAALGVLMATASDAVASCVLFKPRMEACDYLARNPVSFRGRVSSVEEHRIEQRPGVYTRRVRTRIDVLERFAGDAGAAVEVQGHDSSLDPHFERGVEYLVFGTQAPDGVTLSTDTCSGTGRMSEADPLVIDGLRALRGNTGPGTVVHGMVDLSVPDAVAADFGPATRPMPGVTVPLRSATHMASATSGQDGRVAISGLPLGRYRIDVDSPEGTHHPRFLDWDFDVHSLNGCVTHPVGLRYDGRLAGRVVDINGRAVPGVTVRANARHGSQAEATTDDAGGFEIPHLDPGSYELEVAPGAHLPGNIQTSSRLIVVRPGERVRHDEAFVLPAGARGIELTGLVVGLDGRVASHAEVSGEGGFRHMAFDTTGIDGRFRLVVLAGEVYQVRARTGLGESIEAVVAVPHRDLSPAGLTLVLARQPR